MTKLNDGQGKPSMAGNSQKTAKNQKLPTQHQASTWTPKHPTMTKRKKPRNKHLQPLETAGQKAIQTGDAVAELEEGEHPIIPVETPQKIKPLWAARNKQKMPKALSITSYNQVMAK